ncbi:complement C3-like isoform X2 [Nelusetta ayraudi]|uniref:complement C3-like isoform X2 n=1 Tax=Nelusetta ayraudi TaxID=303726 RepID=UPI003F6F9361
MASFCLRTQFLWIQQWDIDGLDCLKLYLFGKEVDGTAYVLFGVLHNDQKYSLPSSLQRVPITSGRGEVTLRREQLTQAFSNVLHLVGSSIFVRVHVLTESGHKMVKAELKNIPIVSSAYSIKFKNTPKYFKPGMIFDVTAMTTNISIPQGREAWNSMLVHPYHSESNSYIHIGDKQGSAGEARPFQGQRTNTHNCGSRYQRHAALIPHCGLLPH